MRLRPPRSGYKVTRTQFESIFTHTYPSTVEGIWCRKVPGLQQRELGTFLRGCELVRTGPSMGQARTRAGRCELGGELGELRAGYKMTQKFFSKRG